MRTERIGKNTVKVIVSGKELNEAGICAADIDGESPLSLMLVSGILERIYADKKRTCVSVEVFPSKDGGCILYISSEASQRETAAYKAVISTDSTQRLIKICRLLSQKSISRQESTVLADRYRIWLITELPGNVPLLTSSIQEHGCIMPADEILLSCIYEHASYIIPENAVTTVLSGA